MKAEAIYCLEHDSEDCVCADRRSVNGTEPHLPPGKPVVSQVATSPTTLRKNPGKSGSLLLERSGADLASADISSIDTLPLLGVRGYIGLLLATLIVAFPKVGKTTLVLELLREWLGLGYRVLVFTEEPEIAWQLRLREMAGDWSKVRFVFAMNADPNELLGRMQEGDEEIVIVDTVRPVFGIDNENDNSETARKVAPWLADCRRLNKTLVALHHMTKAGGDHGRGISGGHALFASFDTALEIERVPGISNRRLVKGYARLLTPEDLLYQREDDGSLTSLGEAKAVTHDEVVKRVESVLSETWQNRTEIGESLAEPPVGKEMIRRALGELVDKGVAERDPAEDKRGATYKWRILPTSPTTALTKGGRSGQDGSTLEVSKSFDSPPANTKPCSSCGEPTFSSDGLCGPCRDEVAS